MVSMDRESIIIVGASARAAAFSAHRAGFAPWWIDQFGDQDLAARFPGARVAPERYPGGMVDVMAAAPDAPFLYTGAMENHGSVLRTLAEIRPLLGNDAEVCAQVRDPFRVCECLVGAGLSAAEVWAGTDHVPAGRWLRKPFRSGGGLSIEPAGGGTAGPAHYLQRFVEGESCAAVFVADGTDAALIGVTLQLVGRPEFHAPPFAYCGSIGPLPIVGDERAQWIAIGTALARGFGLRGLFGVDAVRRGGDIVPVEVNPRYTASVEVHELAGGPATIALHAAACRGSLPAISQRPARGFAAKAHLFAPADMRIRNALDVAALAAGDDRAELADVPEPGTSIRAGAPILSILTRGDDEGGCARLLASTARRLYQALA